MSDLDFVLFLFVYFLIGAVFAGIFYEVGEESILIVPFWPIAIIVAVIGFIFYIPYRIGMFIGDLISRLPHMF